MDGSVVSTLPWTITSRFGEVARSIPERIAVTDQGRILTYGELESRAERLAVQLRRLGVGPESIVGIFMDRSSAMIVALVAILKAGGAYLPLDPVNPEGRLSNILEDAQPKWILTEESLRDRLPANNARALCLDEYGEFATPLPELRSEEQAENAKPENLAYVIYTSGSTGRPKGVMVTHANVTRLITSTEHWFHYGAEDVWTFFHSLAFDYSVWEIWGCLLTGGRLVVVPYLVSRSPEEFLELLVSERVTVLNQTPSAFYQLILADRAAQHPPLDLRMVILSGEALNFRALLPWFEARGDQKPRCINMYGITETTVFVTYREVDMADVQRGVGSLIGVPIPDLTLHVLDPDGKPSPAGETGEIYVGGLGVARGYLNSPELTAARYLPDPFSSDPQARLYRSGDLARCLPDGEVEYLGRADLQVKIRGFRIELGEIESALRSVAGVAEARVLAHTDEQGEKRLVAYYVPADGRKLDPEALREPLRRQLPTYMMPSAFIVVDSMPITANGKLDAGALPKPRFGSASSGENPANGMLAAQIAEIWRRILGAEFVSYDDHFFDIGGNSRLIVIVHRELEDATGRKIPVTDLFAHTTVRKLAAHLENRQAAADRQQEREAKALRQRNAFARSRAERKQTPCTK